MKKQMLKDIFFIVCIIILSSCIESYSYKISNKDKLSFNEFQNPNKYSYPETWFHFIGGNVSKEGITADLEAIADANISGIQLFHGQFGGQWPGVSPQIESLSQSWDSLVLWTAKECSRLGLHFTMQNCPGWSYAGGPWIEPENSMRHLSYSRKDIQGNNSNEFILSKPDIGYEEWRDYKDLFVLAFPTPQDDTGERILPIRVNSNREDISFQDCLINNNAVVIQPSTNDPTIIVVEFDSETTIRSVEFPAINSYSHAWCYSPDVEVSIYARVDEDLVLLASQNLPHANWQDDQPITIACKEVSSNSLTIEIKNKHEMRLSFINFLSAARQQNWESEAAWTLRSIVRVPHPEQDAQSWINSDSIIDITNHFKDNTLTWKVPDGKWTILRIGHYNTGMQNGPAPEEATGWESNKLDSKGVRANFDNYIGRLINTDKVLSKDLLQGVLIDSWECKTQTWRDSLDIIFENKWEYSLIKLFPALFGYVIDEPENTSRFLRDWRVTLNDLLVNNFFGEMSKLTKQNNLRLSFETAAGDVFPADIMEYYKYADIPMCEFWHPKSNSFVGSDEFKAVRPTVSAARLYGKKRVAAESFTSFNLSWDEHPRFLKSIIDYHFTQGITHPVFHTYTHNPRTDYLPPGSSFGAGIGTPFLRLQTWWKHMSHFNKYLARCNYILESGIPVSDVLLYLGDEINHRPKQNINFPEGYKYDYCNYDILLNRLRVKDGKIITPEGLSYSILWLHDCEKMIPESLNKILSFIEQGVTVVGPRPKSIATLYGGKDAEGEFNNLVKKIWDDNLIQTDDIQTAISNINLIPDFSTSSSEVSWLHRKVSNKDVYFISTPENFSFDGEFEFRCEGFPEIWDPVTGKAYSINKISTNSGITKVNIQLPEASSIFVVFNKTKSNKELWMKHYSNILTKDLDWTIKFPSDEMTKDQINIKKLKPWKELNINEETKAFSGTVEYSTEIEFKEIRSDNYVIDLGKVENIAELKINNKYVSTLWCHPYKFDITDFIREGINKIEVYVTSTWYNRLVYDASMPEELRKTWTINGPHPDSQLKDYGLLGPVKVLRSNK